MPTNAPPTAPTLLEEVHCPDCGYDLRGRAGERCPECGLDLDFLRDDAPQIPWQARPSARSYIRTIGLVLRSPRRFAMSAYWPTSYRTAQTFRLTTFLLLLAGLTIVCWLEWPKRNRYYSLQASIEALGPVTAAVFGACWAITAFLATGVAGYAFHPRGPSVRRQNRGIAVSYYALATYTLLLPLMALLAIESATQIGKPAALEARLAILLIGWVILTAYYLYVLTCFARALMPDAAVTARLRLWVPIGWLVLALVGGFIVPGACLLLQLIWVSLAL